MSNLSKETKVLCPKCQDSNVVKSGILNEKQRYKCKMCNYFFTVLKEGNRIDDFWVKRALQLYIEGFSYREIEKMINVSHVSVMNWVKKYNIKNIKNQGVKASYKLLTHEKLIEFLSDKNTISKLGLILVPIGASFMIITWDKHKIS